MAKRRLIPKLQMKAIKMAGKEQFILVTTINFDKKIEVGDPISQAKIYQAQAVDELIFVDIDADAHERGVVLEIIRKAAEVIFLPITIGGGVKSVNDFRELLNNGADKVCINSEAMANPQLITEASQIFGSQCVVVSIDYKQDPDGSFFVWTKGGREKSTWHPLDWAKEVTRLGAGEILLTSIDRDGTKKGLDIEMTHLISNAVPIPVIAAGGCGLASHFVDGFIAGNADAVSAGTFFCFQDQSPMQTRAHIKNAGIPIRIHT